MTNKIKDLTEKNYDYHVFISDIHGDIIGLNGLLSFLLKQYPLEDGKVSLNFLGDYMDRGNYNKAVVERVIELDSKYDDVHSILGNHDDMLLEWLKNPIDSPFLFNGGLQTLNEFMGTNYNYSDINAITYGFEPIHNEDMMTPFRDAFREVTNFLKSLPYIIEHKNIIGVHAGINSGIENWKDTEEFYCLWAREEYFNRYNKTGKYIVSGHTPTSNLNPEKSHDIVSTDDKKYFIDGGSVFGGQLNALVTNSKGECVQVFKTTK